LHTCALTYAGGVKCWGWNGSGRLGDGTVSHRTTPVDVCADAACAEPLSGVTAITAGGQHTCALTATGLVKCWGLNLWGQLGDGTAFESTTPVVVCADATCDAPLSGVSAITAGVSHTCAVTSAGGVKCWGGNGSGQLGDNTTFGRTTPVDVCADETCVVPLPDVSALTAGSEHTCALTSAGGVKCWGSNWDGQLGDGAFTDRTTPFDVCADATCAAPLSGVVAISAGWIHTCAVTSAGGVKCWGWNGSGQLGDGWQSLWHTTPVDVCGDETCLASLSSVVVVSAGSDYTCAVTSAGGVKCWGWNGSGQLGDGTAIDRTTPIDVCADATCETLLGTDEPKPPTPTATATLAATHTATASPSGTSTPTPTSTPSPAATSTPTSGDGGITAVAAGIFHTCALTEAGTVKCWGGNHEGQLGDGTMANHSTPVDVCADEACIVPLTGVVSIATGGLHTCALTSVGGVKCWGHNWWGQLGNGT
jgi:alpha-tubulin suppressor-like RCC1 family protein